MPGITLENGEHRVIPKPALEQIAAGFSARQAAGHHRRGRRDPVPHVAADHRDPGRDPARHRRPPNSPAEKERAGLRILTLATALFRTLRPSVTSTR